MKVWIAGEEATGSLGKSVEDRAASLQNTEYEILLEREADVLKLRDAETTADHLKRYIALMRRESDVDPARYAQPRTPGLKGAISYSIRMFLWRLLRYQHFWMAFRQNRLSGDAGWPRTSISVMVMSPHFLHHNQGWGMGPRRP